MDWNRIEGNWKQAKGKIKEKWGASQTTIWTRLLVSVINSKGKFRSVTGSRKTRSKETLIPGSTVRRGRGSQMALTNLALRRWIEIASIYPRRLWCVIGVSASGKQKKK